MPPTYSLKDFPWRYFAAAVAALCLGDWIGAFLFNGLRVAFPGTDEHLGWLALVSGLALWVVFYLLLRSQRQHPRASGWRHFWQFALALAVLITAFFMVSGVQACLPVQWADFLRAPVSSLLIILISTAVFWWLDQVLGDLAQHESKPRNVRSHLQPRSPSERSSLKVLILFVSLPNKDINFSLLHPANKTATPHAKLTGTRQTKRTLTCASDCPEYAKEVPSSAPAEVTLQGGRSNLKSDILAIKAAGLRWTWQQLLRALCDHDALERVILLGSCDVSVRNEEDTQAKSMSGTYGELKLCKQLLDGYVLRTGGQVIEHPVALDFTDFNALTAALKGIIDTQAEHYPMDQIGIDVTGGQATASIAGAAVTIDRDIAFQYVNTNEPHQTLIYDVIHDQQVL